MGAAQLPPIFVPDVYPFLLGWFGVVCGGLRADSLDLWTSGSSEQEGLKKVRDFDGPTESEFARAMDTLQREQDERERERERELSSLGDPIVCRKLPSLVPSLCTWLGVTPLFKAVHKHCMDVQSS